MRIKVVRTYPKTDYIIGNMYVDGEWFCNTLERPWLNNQPQVSAIPTGTYIVYLTYSAKFSRILPLVMDVPRRSGIRIHAANKVSELQGCIAVGENKVKGMVLNSRKYENDLVKKMQMAKNRQDTITLEII